MDKKGLLPYFAEIKNDKFRLARTFAKICAEGEPQDVKHFLKSSKLRLHHRLDLGCYPSTWPPMFYACRYLNDDVLLYVLHRGAKRDVNLYTEDGMCPLMAVCVGSGPDTEYEAVICAQLLVLVGADACNIKKMHRKRTLLTMAILNRCYGLVAYLIETGCNVNERDGFGETPFNIAVAGNMDTIVELLYNSGVNPFIKNIDGQQCKQLAKKHSPLMRDLVLNILYNYFKTECNGDRKTLDDMLARVNVECVPCQKVARRVTETVKASNSSSRYKKLIIYGISIVSVGMLAFTVMKTIF